jgi:hypothetical protein
MDIGPPSLKVGAWHDPTQMETALVGSDDIPAFTQRLIGDDGQLRSDGTDATGLGPEVGNDFIAIGWTNISGHACKLSLVKPLIAPQEGQKWSIAAHEQQ